jgi:tetratricopeptide (TPR) repeat protein
MVMRPNRTSRELLIAFFFVFLFAVFARAQNAPSEQVQVGPPPLRRAEPPKAEANPEDLEKRGDELRSTKYYLDAIDFYNAALQKKPNDSVLLNKLGITELQLQHYKDAKKNFERSIKSNRQYADAYNNLGVIYYISKKYGKAIKEYSQAIDLNNQAASYFSNLGAAYFSKKEFEKAIRAYSQAIQLDPEVFERVSHSGVSAQMSKPEDRAHYDYVLAKLYAKMGVADRSLQYLRRAMEEGYKGIQDVYKDAEFAELRKDPRFTALMAAKPPAIPE